MHNSPLLNLMWRAGAFSGRTFDAVGGERVTVVSEGESVDETPGVWRAVEVIVDGRHWRGPAAVGADVSVPPGAVLRVVERDALPVLGIDDLPVMQVVCNIPPGVIEIRDSLRAGAADCACGARIAAMESLHRTVLFTALAVERLQRKTASIMQIFDSSESDWNQTFHTLLLRAMGGDRNRDAFTMLAGKATSAMVSREKGSPVAIEALLLGTAGFLFGDPETKDDYTLRLEEEARHLFAKYSITPMPAAVWNLAKLYPANHPALRLAEIAALLGKRDFMLSGVLACRTRDDIERLFAAEASDYWRTHYVPSGPVSAPAAKTIGRAKARLVGINLAAPLMFAYGRREGNDELCERSTDLLAAIPPERNRVLEGWYAAGCAPENAFESQALLQLAGEYCARGACVDCRIGRPEIKKALAHKTSAINA